MRLITRSDFDGLACSALLEYLGLIDDYKFVHPKDIQDGLVEAGSNDIVANIPYIKGCKLWFDHHYSESERMGNDACFEGVSRAAPSCARVIYDYYGGSEKLSGFDTMLTYVDKVDSGDLTREEIFNPTGWILLGFIMDPRTGLGRFRNFTISNYQLMLKLAKACVNKSIDEILALSDVQERIEVYHEQSEAFTKMLTARAKIEGNAVILDLRGVETINAGNRFLMYTLFPEQNISVWIVDGKNKQNVSVTVGHSIINKTATINVGSLLLGYGGGGHVQVGSCQPDYARADGVIREIIDKVK